MKKTLFPITIAIMAFICFSCGDDDDDNNYKTSTPTITQLEAGSGCWALDNNPNVFIKFKGGKFWFFDLKNENRMVSWDYNVSGTTLSISTKESYTSNPKTIGPYTYTIKLEEGFYKTGQKSLLITGDKSQSRLTTGHYGYYPNDILK